MALSSDDLAELAGAPKSTSKDGVQMTEHGLRDLIEFDRYLAERDVDPFAVLRSRTRPIRRVDPFVGDC